MKRVLNFVGTGLLLVSVLIFMMVHSSFVDVQASKDLNLFEDFQATPTYTPNLTQDWQELINFQKANEQAQAEYYRALTEQMDREKSTSRSFLQNIIG